MIKCLINYIYCNLINPKWNNQLSWHPTYQRAEFMLISLISGTRSIEIGKLKVVDCVVVRLLERHKKRLDEITSKKMKSSVADQTELVRIKVNKKMIHVI
jgi:hypothetical protein